MKIEFATLEAAINKKRPSVNAQIRSSHQSGGIPLRRSRIRTKGEAEALTALVLAKKHRAVKEGTFVVKEAGKIYFDAY